MLTWTDFVLSFGFCNSCPKLVHTFQLNPYISSAHTHITGIYLIKAELKMYLLFCIAAILGFSPLGGICTKPTY
jgi:hypothetical protein